MFNDIGKAIYWIVIFFVALFVISISISHPGFAATLVGGALLWCYIDSQATKIEENKEESKEETK